MVLGEYNENDRGEPQLESEGALFFLNTIKKDISFTVYGSIYEGHFTLADCENVEKI